MEREQSMSRDISGPDAATIEPNTGARSTPMGEALSLGAGNARVYYGSWVEWGKAADTEVET